ncbi:hypothetical protein BDP27DRAFT_1337263 [Rhodocollybia butyracea]|uniref:Uncharacterized protein n=1 Tax=Rhodocollybia butyracea TaxID=206335 RepID=A0A9P5PH52_9AGAR|nr:hypothetical protein BDP27DRAFT_1337263 [Rhodocollybia butyracea]
MYMFMTSACLHSVMRVMRQVVGSRQITGSGLTKTSAFLEGTGRISGEMSVEVPWVCARMWKEMGLDWED